MKRICDRCLTSTRTKRLGRMSRYCFRHYADALRERSEATAARRGLGDVGIDVGVDGLEAASLDLSRHDVGIDVGIAP